MKRLFIIIVREKDMARVSDSAIEDARRTLAENGGILRTRDALAAGIQRRTLYAMRDRGMVERLARGLYRLADLEQMSDPDLAIVAARIPGGVVCLISALAYHDITTEIPHAVDIALDWQAGSRTAPTLDWPPIDVWWYSGDAYSAGIEIHSIDGVDVKVYSAEKTLADCFKYRNKIGLDTAIEALRMYRDKGRMDVPEIIRYAGICRVKNIMRPYVEALL